MAENVSATPTSLHRTERVRLAVYHGFARTGQAPSVPELAALTAFAPDQVRQELRALHQSRDASKNHFTSRQQTRRAVAAWIDEYNLERRHSTNRIDGISTSPIAYERAQARHRQADPDAA